MLVLNSNVLIGNILFDNMLVNCEVKSSRQDFTETATITVPNNLRRKNRRITDYIKINDPVTVNLGYYPDTNLIFTGYVSKITPDSPAVIHCENEAFKWKQKSVGPFSGRKLTLQSLLTGVGYTGLLSIGTDAEIGDWVVAKNKTVLNVLEEIKNNFGFNCYWRKDKTLYIAEDFKTTRTSKKFDFQKNIISTDLEQIVNAGDISPVSHGVSIQKDNKKIELYAYYLDNEIVLTDERPAGTLNTLNVPYLSEKALGDLIKRRLPNLRNDGMGGSFLVFGAPMVEHGDAAQLIDNKFKERNGSWRIEAVETSFGTGGFRQKIYLDSKIG